MSTPRSAPRPRPSGSPFRDPVPVPIEVFAVGDRVTHDQQGLGRVTAVEDGVAVVVEFGGRTVRIVSPYAKLSKL